ncbi:hypothetical protein HOY80DRAFT_1140492 [Tuber brumale]|nr:hypothetical protein HOY80DRAFT_1140492 [Tuber brumale]
MEVYTNPVVCVRPVVRMNSAPPITVSPTAATLIVSAYTILILFIFMVGWNLVLAIITGSWPTRRNPNRYVASVAPRNSRKSINPVAVVLEYCVRMISGWLRDTDAGREAPGSTASGQGQYSGYGEQVATEREKLRTAAQTPKQIPKSPTPNRKPEVSILLWGILFFFISFAMSARDPPAAIPAAGKLVMEKAAPPVKAATPSPNVAKYSRWDDDSATFVKSNSLNAPSVLRALRSIDARDVTVRKRVNLQKVNPPSRRANEPSAGIDYDYNVTGVDMGLRTEPKLRLHVIGSCQTNYTWLENSTNAGDYYRLFGGDEFYLAKLQPEVESPPTVNLEVNQKDIDSGSDRISFAMIVNTGGRSSYTSGEDPWYFTELTGGKSIPYQIRRERPVLSCLEKSRWHLNGKDVETSKLETLPGLTLHKPSIGLFKMEFAMPRMVSLVWLAGPSALKSASFAPAPSFILDAGASNIVKDLERLVLASWVSSGNFLRDTTTYTPNDMVNFAKGEKTSVEDFAAKPVPKSGDVSIFLALILISIPAILLPLLVIAVCFSCVLRRICPRRPSIFCDYVVRGIALWATKLYRYFDEELYSRVRWSHRLAPIPAMHKPYGGERSKLLRDEEPQYLPGSARGQGNQQYPLRTNPTGTGGKLPEAKEACMTTPSPD